MVRILSVGCRRRPRRERAGSPRFLGWVPPLLPAESCSDSSCIRKKLGALHRATAPQIAPQNCTFGTFMLEARFPVLSRRKQLALLSRISGSSVAICSGCGVLELRASCAGLESVSRSRSSSSCISSAE